uniref:Uncharacterized protein n=1 Tax=viral metagenome TaxID=1070528 RepID=A0A6C0DCT9_9ZZZZ
MDQQTPQLNPADLYDKRKSKDASRLKAYNKILEQIYNRVRVISKLPNSPCYLLYTVPPFILGLPKIDLEDCVIYLIYQLRHAGYDVRYTPPNMIYLSWVHHEKSYLVQQSPIMQAMLESAEKTNAELERKEKEASRLLQGRKSQRKVRMNTPGELQRGIMGGGPRRSAISTVLNRPLSNPTAGPPPPSAADYVPPSAFLQTMEQPQNTVVQPKSSIDYFR